MPSFYLPPVNPETLTGGNLLDLSTNGARQAVKADPKHEMAPHTLFEKGQKPLRLLITSPLSPLSSVRLGYGFGECFGASANMGFIPNHRLVEDHYAFLPAYYSVAHLGVREVIVAVDAQDMRRAWQYADQLLQNDATAFEFGQIMGIIGANRSDAMAAAAAIGQQSLSHIKTYLRDTVPEEKRQGLRYTLICADSLKGRAERACRDNGVIYASKVRFAPVTALANARTLYMSCSDSRADVDQRGLDGVVMSFRPIGGTITAEQMNAPLSPYASLFDTLKIAGGLSNIIVETHSSCGANGAAAAYDPATTDPVLEPYAQTRAIKGANADDISRAFAVSTAQTLGKHAACACTAAFFHMCPDKPTVKPVLSSFSCDAA